MITQPNVDAATLETQEIDTVEPSGAERRRFRRVELNASINLRSQDTFFTGFSENISEGGLFVATEAPHPLGTIMEISLSLMGEPPRTLSGEVVWIRPHNARGGLPAGIGLRFIGLREEERTRLQEFVDSQVKDVLFYDLD